MLVLSLFYDCTPCVFAIFYYSKNPSYPALVFLVPHLIRSPLESPKQLVTHSLQTTRPLPVPYCYYVQVNHSFWLVSTSSLMTVGLNNCFHNKLFSGLGSNQRNPVMILLYVDLNHPKIIKYYYFSPYQLFCLKIFIIRNAVRFRNFLHTLI